MMYDSWGRTVNYMRISVTDRCNLRCRYCMPHGIRTVSMQEILTFEEIVRVVRAAVAEGITRFKVTGGEPLARRGTPALCAMLKAIPGVEQVTMTTNGVLLAEHIGTLAANGLDAVNVSLDTTDAEVYQQITGFDHLADALKGIDSAYEAGLAVKINSVLMRGINDDAFSSLISFAKDRAIDVRFIEMMPIGQGARFEGVNNTTLLRHLQSRYPDLEKDTRTHGNGPAVYVRIPSFHGSIGFISAIHGMFCETCNRLRLTAMGDLKPCLCYGDRIGLRDVLRDQSLTEAERDGKLRSLVRQAVCAKPRAHRFGQEKAVTEASDMVSIGG